MKKMRSFLALLAATLILGSCANPPSDFTGVDYAITPLPLEVHNGKVEGTVTITFPDEYIDPSGLLEMTLQLSDEAGITELTTLTVQGEEYEGNNTVIREGGGATTVKFSVDYKESMRVSELQAKAVGTVGKKSVEIPAIKIGDGVIATSTLVDADGVFPALGVDNYRQIVPETKEAAINYAIQSAVIRSSETRQEDVEEMNAYLKEAKADERKELASVEISSYASPDGATDLNTKVSDNRGSASEKYVNRQLNRAKLEDVEVVSATTPEDWDGFKKAVEASDIQDKELILRVLSMYDDPEKREEEIKNIAATYQELAKDILPQLRRSNIFVNVNLIGLSDEEIAAQYAEDPSALNVEHLLYYAAMLETNEEKLEVYQKAAELYPEDWRTYNDVAYIYIEEGQFAEATAALNKAAAVAKTPEVNNNLGALSLADGDVDAAKQSFGEAAGVGAPLDYNMGIVAMIEADYATATSKLKGAATNNAALAFILNKDYASATAELDAVEEADALTYYLKAIVAARQSNEADVVANLKEAIALDASLKETAATDLEFAAYFENEAFKAL